MVGAPALPFKVLGANLRLALPILHLWLFNLLRLLVLELLKLLLQFIVFLLCLFGSLFQLFDANVSGIYGVVSLLDDSLHVLDLVVQCSHFLVELGHESLHTDDLCHVILILHGHVEEVLLEPYHLLPEESELLLEN